DSDKEHLMPTAVLLSSREELHFEQVDLDSTAASATSDFGWVELTAPLYKVDGQHRTEGFALAVEDRPELGAFPLPTVIMEVSSKMQEIRQFFTVNTTAKRVRTDLADRLLEAMGEFTPDSTKGWMVDALQVVDYLNNERGGPWEGLIKMPNS